MLFMVSGCSAPGNWGKVMDAYAECGKYEAGSEDHLYCLDKVYRY